MALEKCCFWNVLFLQNLEVFCDHIVRLGLNSHCSYTYIYIHISVEEGQKNPKVWGLYSLFKWIPVIKGEMVTCPKEAELTDPMALAFSGGFDIMLTQ